MRKGLPKWVPMSRNQPFRRVVPKVVFIRDSMVRHPFGRQIFEQLGLAYPVVSVPPNPFGFAKIVEIIVARHGHIFGF